MKSLLLLSILLLPCFIPAFVSADSEIIIKLDGLDQQLEKNVLLYLSLEQQREKNSLSETRIHQLHKKSSTEIANALMPYGYYKPEIQTKLTKFDNKSWLAEYIIDPGPAITIRKVKLDVTEPMRSDAELNEILDSHNIKKGSTFSHLEYERLKSRLTQFASESGYIEARFTEHRVEIDLNTYRVDIYLTYQSGQRYNFGQVNINQSVIESKLLDRYIQITRGKPYSHDKLLDLQQALNDSDYFHTVEVSPANANNITLEIPINIVLTPKKKHRFSLGLGYGSDTGARTQFNWQIPVVNPEGHRFNSETEISELGYNIGAQYRIPVLNPRTDQLVYSAGVINEETETNESTLQTVGIRINYNRSHWREAIALNYQREDFSVAGTNGDSTLLIPGISWSRTWGETFIYAIDGVRFDLELRGANDNFYSDTSFAQVKTHIKAISSFTHNTRVIGRGTIGTIESDHFEELPSSIRFFAGGAQSVRGYAYESLGPTNESDEVIGGKHLLVGSVELEHWVTSKWGIAVFYDTGNAIDDYNDSLKDGAGIGYRWKSPVGPVRIDLANAISDKDRPWRIHINIGPDL